MVRDVWLYWQDTRRTTYDLGTSLYMGLSSSGSDFGGRGVRRQRRLPASTFRTFYWLYWHVAAR